MKKLFLSAAVLLGTLSSLAQDPDLFQTWYLYTIEFENGDIVDVASFDPPIAPTFIMDTSFNFQGDGACNTFNGTLNFSPPNDFSVLTMDNTATPCGFFEDEFEINYFTFFTPGEFFNTIITDVGGGEQTLGIVGGPFTRLNFRNVPILANSSFQKSSVTPYPNPVVDQLFITSENNTLQELTIYDTQGKKVFDTSTVSSPLDVSSLSTGLYFLEVISENGKAVQKFIKN